VPFITLWGGKLSGRGNCPGGYVMQGENVLLSSMASYRAATSARVYDTSATETPLLAGDVTDSGGRRFISRRRGDASWLRVGARSPRDRRDHRDRRCVATKLLRVGRAAATPPKLNTVDAKLTAGAAKLTIIIMCERRHGDNVMHERAGKLPAAPVAVMTCRGQSLDR